MVIGGEGIVGEEEEKSEERERERRGDLCEGFLRGHGLGVGLLEWRNWFMAHWLWRWK